MARKTAKTEKGQPDQDLLSRPPDPNQHRLPCFAVHDEDLEEILSDIADKEPGIVRAELKRTTGVAQYGVDVEGFSDEQQPVLVISCKRYKKIQPSDLAIWSTDFLKHVGGHWKDKGVERFVLAVSVDLNDDGLNDQITLESARFRALGIRYEVWGLKKLTEKLRPLPHTIVRFFPAGWLERVGAGMGLVASTAVPSPGTSTANSIATAAVTQSLNGVADAVRQRLGSATADRLETALQNLHEGIARPLRSLVAELKADRISWDALADDIKAKFLRAEGSLAIRDNDLASAKACYADAAVYSPPPDRTPSVLVARLEVGPASALELVCNPATSSEASIRTGLLLELEKPDEALGVLDVWPNTSPTDDAYEPARLRSIAQLWQDRPGALATISRVEHVAPRQFAVQWAAAVVRFNFALSGKFAPTLSTFPNPIPQGLVRETEDARRALDEAERIFDILSRTVDTPDQAADLRVWRLACLILNPGRSTDAGQFAAALLEGDNPHPGAVVWATAAGLAFDQDDVVRALNSRLNSGAADASHAVAIAYLTFTRGAKDRALSALKRHRKLFSDELDLKLVDYWIALLGGKGGDSRSQKFNAALGKLRTKGNPTDLLEMLDTGTLDPDMQLAAFENLALNGKWIEINDRRSTLLAFRTSEASEIVIRAAFGLSLHKDVVSLATELADTFYGSRLPVTLGVLLAKSQLSLGDAALALRAFKEMRANDSSNELAFEDALMRLRIGDVTGAASVLRGRKTPDGSPEALLKIAAELRYEDPELAKDLLAGISFGNLNRKLLPQALTLVNELGLRAAANAIMPRLFGPDAPPSGITVLNSVEEAIEFANSNAARIQEADAALTEKWLRGEIPLHLVFDGRATDLAWFFHRAFRARPRLQDDGTVVGKPFLLRAGIRQVETTAPSGLLVLDATALLLGQELGLLEHLEHAWPRMLLPNETPELLRTMEIELEEQFGHVADEAHDIRRDLEAGRFASSGSNARVRRLVITPQGEDPTHVSLNVLLAHLVAHGMDRELAERAKAELSLDPVADGPPLNLPLEFEVEPNELVTLHRVGLLNRLAESVSFYVADASTMRWLSGFDDHLEGQALAGKVKALRELVAKKANSGTWGFLPVDLSKRDGLREMGASGRLFFSLIRAGEREPCEIWAEDRTLSLVGKLEQATIIDVRTVLGRISHRLSEPQVAGAWKRLRAAGYGFTLPANEAIVDALLSTATEGAVLVESDELAAIRRDFAVQFANSRHLIDKASVAAPTEPELLFLSRLLGLAGKVLAALWSRSNVGDERLSAAATWVARHLRVDQAKFLPRENRSVAGREGLLYLQHLSLVGSMFNVTGSSLRQSRERRSKLLEWVLGSIVEPALELHPTFRERLINYFADALASLGELDSDQPDVTENILAGVVLDYINAFPEHWRVALQRHEKLSHLVGLRELKNVSIGKNFTFEAAEFYAAVAEAYANGKATAPMMGGKRSAVITRIYDAVPAADKPVAFMVKAGSKTVNFADDRLELETSDIEQRLRALKRHPSWFDQGGTELEAAARSIAENPDPNARRQLLGNAQDKAMTWRLKTLQEQIRQRSSSDKALLLPPHPDSVRQFLRLASPIDVSGQDWLDQSFTKLREEVGPLGALARIGGLPFELGGAIEKALLDAVDEVGLDEALHLAGPTPMVRTGLFAALLRAGKTELDLSGLTLPWNDHGVLFQSLLRLAFRGASRSYDWGNVPEPERSILLWTHSNAVLEILAGEGAAPREAARIIDSFMNQRIDDVYRRSRSHASRLLDPAGNSWRETAGAGIAYAIRDCASSELDNGQRDQLRTTVARQVGNDWLVELELWVPKGSVEPPGCWLAIDAAAPLAEAGIAALPSPIDERDPRKMASLLQQRIVDEAVAEEASGYWPVLWMLGVDELDAEASARMNDLIGSPDRLPDFDAQDGGVWAGALRYRGELYGVDDNVDGFRQTLIAAAEQARANHPGERVSELSIKSSIVTTFHRVGEAIWQFSSASSSTLVGCSTRFAESIIVLADAWPESLLACLALLEVIAAQLDTEPAGPLWDAINLLRSR